MKLVDTKQIHINQFSDFDKFNFDFMIASSGFESRSSYLSENLRQLPEHKYSLSFTSFENILARKKNDIVFEKQGFKNIYADGDLTDQVAKLLIEIESCVTKDKLNLLIDYSSMTRLWYATIINHFRFVSNSFKEVNLYFSYSLGKFTLPPDQDTYGGVVNPIDGFSNLSIPDKPTCLIIALGYEKNRALGLKEYFEAEEVYLFYTDSSGNKDYPTYVESNNKNLLVETEQSKIIRYPLNDLFFTETLLENLCNYLRHDYRVIIAPSGPKPFTLISLLTSSKFPEIEVWRVSGGTKIPPVDKEPDGKILLLKTTFTEQNY